MRLPHHAVSSPLFLFENVDQLILALGHRATDESIPLIKSLTAANLPPIVSSEALAVMLGVNSGVIWSFINRTRRHYRTFDIPKGRETRRINAPRVALKVVQKWMSIHLANVYVPPDHVFGFITGRSHIDAAMKHEGADWAFSADIANFFGSTPLAAVASAFEHLGYDATSSNICARLTCFEGVLAQGAPSSPVLSNICFRHLDEKILVIAQQFNCNVTRYVDDIVFSGSGNYNPDLRIALNNSFVDTPWKLAPDKNRVQPIKGRIKVHGLLIGKNSVRLTKGYRNQIRGFAHVLAKKGESAANAPKLRGHVEYARHVGRTTETPTGIAQKTDILLTTLKADRDREAINNSSQALNLLNRLRRFVFR